MPALPTDHPLARRCSSSSQALEIVPRYKVLFQYTAVLYLLIHVISA